MAHEFLGTDINGKDAIIIDDKNSSGDSILDVAKQLKARGAGRIFVFSTFGLFTSGLERFDKAYEEGLISKICTTNTVYQTPELLARDWYVSCDMSKYIALLIDTLNHDGSISDLLEPYERINAFVAKYKEAQQNK